MIGGRRRAAHLVQRPHRDLGDVVGDELPGGALRVAGGEALPVPHVAYGEQRGRTGSYLCVSSPRKGSDRLASSQRLTVFVDGEDGGPPHRQLPEGLSGGRGDVVPAFSCRWMRGLDVWLYLLYLCIYSNDKP